MSPLPDLNLLKALFPFFWWNSGHHTSLWGDSTYCMQLSGCWFNPCGCLQPRCRVPLPTRLPSAAGPPLTSQSRSHGRLLFGLLADPLLAALPGELHSARVGAVGAGQADVHAAEGHAAHRPVQAGALVLAAALEGLAAPVHHAAEDAGGTVPSCQGHE